MYGTSVCLPTSAEVEQPSAGADPPLVFKRWMKVVLVMTLPPVGPCCDPIDCSKRQAIAPAFGQLGSEPAGIDMHRVAPTPCCYRRNSATSRCRRVAGLGQLVGVCIGAEEVGDDLEVLPEETRKKGGFGASAVDGPGSACGSWAGKHSLEYPPRGPTKRRSFPAGGVMMGEWWGRRCSAPPPVDRAECASEREGGYQQPPNSRCGLTIKVIVHIFVFSFLH